jgi:hypothetical protein
MHCIKNFETNIPQYIFIYDLRPNIPFKQLISSTFIREETLKYLVYIFFMILQINNILSKVYTCCATDNLYISVRNCLNFFRVITTHGYIL